MERKELKNKVKELQAKKEELEGLNFVYSSGDFYFPSIGRICELDKSELVRAYSILSREKQDAINAAKELGFDQELNLTSEYGDFDLDEIFKDLKTRAAEIKVEDQLDNIFTALEVLERHLSADDKYEMDMEALKNAGLL